MIKLPYPSFISVEINKKSVYSKLLYGDFTYSNYCRPQVINDIMKSLNDNIPIGISLYGDIIDADIIDIFIEFCNKHNICLGYDIACNKNTMNVIKKYYNEIQLFRVVLYSLDAKINDSFGGNNKLSDIKSFVKEISSVKTGKVLVIPVVHENIDEIEQLIKFSLMNNFHANPFPLPYKCALRINATPLSKGEFIRLSKIISRYYSIYKNNIYLDIPTAYEIIKKSSICPAFRLSVDVSSDGQIRYCKFSNQKLGYINNLDSIWHKKYIKLPEKCIACENKEKCGGGCIANVKQKGEHDLNCLI